MERQRGIQEAHFAGSQQSPATAGVAPPSISHTSLLDQGVDPDHLKTETQETELSESSACIWAKNSLSSRLI